MKPAIKRAWIKALRSGKYKQGRGMLRTRENTFCCLGVLCDLRSRQLRRSPWKQNDHGYWSYGQRYNDAVLTPAVMRWAGLKSTDPVINAELSLSGYNDSRKYGFKQIARLIEKHL